MAFDKLVAFQDWVNSAISSAISSAIALLRVAPVGAVMPYAGSSAPTGWLLCQGQAVSRTTYAALFAAIGTTYGGGDGSTTFNVPDLSGRVVAGKEVSATRLTAAIAGFNGDTLGAAGGNQRLHQHTHAVSDPGHGHGVNDPGHAHNILLGTYTPAVVSRASFGDGTNQGIHGGVVQSSGTGIGIVANGTGISIQNSGAGAAQNVQPTIVLNYIIAT